MKKTKKTQKQLREEEKQFKAKLEVVKLNCIKTEELYFDLFLKPFDDLIKYIDMYKKREINKKQFINITEKINKRILEVRGKNGF